VAVGSPAWLAVHSAWSAGAAWVAVGGMEDWPGRFPRWLHSASDWLGEVESAWPVWRGG
jgi:hypothetical protein